VTEYLQLCVSFFGTGLIMFVEVALCVLHFVLLRLSFLYLFTFQVRSLVYRWLADDRRYTMGRERRRG
jgi:hypothetical protein